MKVLKAKKVVSRTVKTRVSLANDRPYNENGKIRAYITSLVMRQRRRGGSINYKRITELANQKFGVRLHMNQVISFVGHNLPKSYIDLSK